MSGPAHTLSAHERVRYARQISLAEVGEAGQLRLCGAHVALAAQSRPLTREAAQVAQLYLERAGVAVTGSLDAASTQPSDDDALAHAAAWLRGSFAAVEQIKAVLGVGTSARIPESFALAATRAFEEQSP